MGTPTKWGSEFLVNTPGAGNVEVVPDISGLPNGQFVVVWKDDSQSGDDTSSGAIRGQIFNADGSTSGPSEFLVNTTTSGDQSHPAVWSLDDGRFVVAWYDNSQTGGDTSGNAVRAQVFNVDGSKSGTEFLVNTTTFGNQENVDVTGLPGGRFVITWIDYMSVPSTYAVPWVVRAQVFNADSSKSGTEFQVNTPSVNIQTWPVVAMLADDRFVIRLG